MINPLAKQAVETLELLQTYFQDYIQKNHVNEVPLEVVHLYTGLILKNAKKERACLFEEKDMRAFDFMISEIDSLLSVFGGTCIKYCEEHRTEDVELTVLQDYFRQMKENLLD